MNRPPLILAAVLLAACTNGPRAVPPPEGFVLGPVTPGTSPLPIAAIYPMDAEARGFREPETEGTITRIIETTDRFDAAWVLREDDRQSDFLIAEADGGLALTVSINESRNTVTRFQPPMIVSGAVLEPGIPHESEAEMQVFEGGSKRRLKEKGTARRSVVYAGNQTLTLPDGTVHEAQRVEVDFRADLRLAKVHRHEVVLVTETLGPLLIQSSQNVTVLGVLPTNETRTLVRRLALQDHQ